MREWIHKLKSWFCSAEDFRCFRRPPLLPNKNAITVFNCVGDRFTVSVRKFLYDDDPRCDCELEAWIVIAERMPDGSWQEFFLIPEPQFIELRQLMDGIQEYLTPDD